jgi:hypothetical protein
VHRRVNFASLLQETLVMGYKQKMGESDPLFSLRQFIAALPATCLALIPEGAHVTGYAAAWYVLGQPAAWRPVCITMVVPMNTVTTTTRALVDELQNMDPITVHCTAQWIQHKQATQLNLTANNEQFRLVIQGNPYESIDDFISHDWSVEPEALAVELVVGQTDLPIKGSSETQNWLTQTLLGGTEPTPPHSFWCRYVPEHESPLSAVKCWHHHGILRWTIVPDLARLSHLRKIGLIPNPLTTLFE